MVGGQINGGIFMIYNRANGSNVISAMNINICVGYCCEFIKDDNDGFNFGGEFAGRH